MTVTGRLRGWLAPALAALALCMAAPHAIAQTAVPVPKSTPSADQSAPPAATREDLQNMLETLRDPAKRDELAKQIETMLQAQQAAGRRRRSKASARGMLSALSTGFQQFGQFMENVARGFGATGNLLTWLEVQGTDPQLRAMWLEIGKDLALSLGAGALAAYRGRSCRQVRPAPTGAARRRPAVPAHPLRRRAAGPRIAAGHRIRRGRASWSQAGPRPFRPRAWPCWRSSTRRSSPWPARSWPASCSVRWNRVCGSCRCRIRPRPISTSGRGA